jgi:hypothetical protein
MGRVVRRFCLVIRKWRCVLVGLLVMKSWLATVVSWLMVAEKLVRSLHGPCIHESIAVRLEYLVLALRI